MPSAIILISLCAEGDQYLGCRFILLMFNMWVLFSDVVSNWVGSWGVDPHVPERRPFERGPSQNGLILFLSICCINCVYRMLSKWETLYQSINAHGELYYKCHKICIRKPTHFNVRLPFNQYTSRSSKYICKRMQSDRIRKKGLTHLVDLLLLVFILFFVGRYNISIAFWRYTSK